jgi:hypothetical protein
MKVYRLRLSAKAEARIRGFSKEARAMTTIRLLELRHDGEKGAEGRVFHKDREYYWASTPLTFIVFGVEGGELIVVYTAGSRTVR